MLLMLLALLLMRYRAEYSISRRGTIIGIVLTAAIVLGYIFIRYVLFPP